MRPSQSSDGIGAARAPDLLLLAAEWPVRALLRAQLIEEGFHVVAVDDGEAVYGAGPSPFGEEFGEYIVRGASDLRGGKLFLSQTEWRVTTKPGKLFFTFFNEPRAAFALPVMKNRMTRAYRLADGAAVELGTAGNRTTLVMERPIVDPMATVVVVEFEGTSVQR